MNLRCPAVIVIGLIIQRLFLVADHRKVAQLCEQELGKTSDPQLKTYIQKTLPTVRSHLQHAESIEKTPATNKASQASLSGSRAFTASSAPLMKGATDYEDEGSLRNATYFNTYGLFSLGGLA